MEPLNFSDDVVQGSNRGKRAILENWLMDGLGLQFWSTCKFNRLYLTLQRCRMSSKCFWKVSRESKVIPRNFTCG